jgi:hypothetical protein
MRTTMLSAKQIKSLNVLKQFENTTRRLGAKWDKELEVDDSKKGESKLALLIESVKILEPLYRSEIKQLRRRINGMRTRNKRLFSKTAFEVMKRHAIEESHSNVLAYLLNENIGGKELLRAMLINVKTQEAEGLSKLLIARKAIHIGARREYPIDGKRIDIAIEIYGYIVLIENKFKASLHMVDNEFTQTEYYYKLMKKKYPNKPLVCIILDNKGTEESASWTTLDYKQLLSALDSLKELFSNNLVFLEYHRLLRRISLHLTEKEESKEEEGASLSILRETILEAKKWHLKMN